MRFALNHIVAPRLDLQGFLALAGRLGIADIEIRNDLPDLTAMMQPAAVRRAAGDAGMTILSVNALQSFNRWSQDRADASRRLADYAAEAGARAVVLCPANDGSRIGHSEVVAALDALAPILAERGLQGLLEPLGFATSSLRRKAEALAAITEADDGAAIFRLLHDSFHHHLSGESELFPRRTGLVHVSAVMDPALATADMRDSHRVLNGPGDRLDSRDQIRTLVEGGYDGPFSFEPFAAEIHESADIEAALKAAMAHLRDAP